MFPSVVQYIPDDGKRLRSNKIIGNTKKIDHHHNILGQVKYENLLGISSKTLFQFRIVAEANPVTF